MTDFWKDYLGEPYYTKLAIRIYAPFDNPDFWDIGKWFLMGKLPFGYGFYIGVIQTTIKDFPLFMYVDESK